MNLKVYLFEGTSTEVNSSFKTFIKNQHSSATSSNVVSTNRPKQKKKRITDYKVYTVIPKRSTKTLNSKQATVVNRFLRRRTPSNKNLTFTNILNHLKKTIPNDTPSNVALANYLISNNYTKKVVTSSSNRKTTYWIKA